MSTTFSTPAMTGARRVRPVDPAVAASCAATRQRNHVAAARRDVARLARGQERSNLARMMTRTREW